MAKGESDSKELTNLVSINRCCAFIQSVTSVVSRWMSSDNVFVCSVPLSLPGVDKIIHHHRHHHVPERLGVFPVP